MNGSYILKLVKNLGESHKGRCPALVENKNGTFSCGIVLNPKKYIKRNYPEHILRKYFMVAIGAGVGCDELLDDDSAAEEDKLNDIIDAMKNNSQWRENAMKAIKIIHGIE